MVLVNWAQKEKEKQIVETPKRKKTEEQESPKKEEKKDWKKLKFEYSEEDRQKLSELYKVTRDSHWNATITSAKWVHMHKKNVWWEDNENKNDITNEIFDFLKKNNKIILLAFILVLVVFSFFAKDIYSKYETNRIKNEIIDQWVKVLCETKYMWIEWVKWTVSCFEKNKAWETNLWTIWTIVRWCYNKNFKDWILTEEWSQNYINCINFFESSIFQTQVNVDKSVY